MDIRNRLLILLILALTAGSCGGPGDAPASGREAVTDLLGRDDRWEVVGPGGGSGSLRTLAVNPSDPAHVLVSSDLSASFVSLDGGDHWRMFNLCGAVGFFEFDREDPQTVYAGTSSRLFKSTDRGRSWATIYPEPSRIVAVHPQGDQATELVVTEDSTHQRIEALAVDPETPDRLFLLVRREKVDIWPPHRGVRPRFYMAILVSEDGGEHWELTDKLRFEINDILIDPASPPDNRTIYVAGIDGIGAKKDGLWREVGRPEGTSAFLQVADAFDRATGQYGLYALVAVRKARDGSGGAEVGLFKTLDGGRVWQQVYPARTIRGSSVEAAPVIEQIAVSGNAPGQLYISCSDRALDGGCVENVILKASPSGFEPVLSLNGANSQILMGFSASAPGTGYAALGDRIFRTENGGGSWEQVHTRQHAGNGLESRGIQLASGAAFGPHPADSLLVMADPAGIFRSRDGGLCWTAPDQGENPPYQGSQFSRILYDEEAPGKLWLAMTGTDDWPHPGTGSSDLPDASRGGILVSSDTGSTWTPTGASLGGSPVTDLLMDPNSPPGRRTLYACVFGKGVFKSLDDGITWEQKNQGIESESPAAMRISLGAGGRLYLVTAPARQQGTAGNTDPGAVYMSTDGAGSWEPIALPEGVNRPTSLLAHPRRPGRLLLSAWGRYGETPFSPDRGGGIYLSTNGGDSWMAVLSRDPHITDLTYDRRNGRYYAAGFNSSAYVSEDRGRSWKRIPGYNFKRGKHVVPDPADRDKVYICTYGGGVWHGPVKGGKPVGEGMAGPQTLNRNTAK